jgi:site-specific DNA-adenine methylase
MEHKILGVTCKYVLPALHAGNVTVIPYPGGKSYVASDIFMAAPDDVDAIAVPFLGGGSLLFAAIEKYANRECRIIASDTCDVLYSLFVGLQKHGRCVAEYLNGIRQHYGYVTRELFDRCVVLIGSSSDIVEKAVAAYIYFRSVWVSAARFFRNSGYSEKRGQRALSDDLIRRLPVMAEKFHNENYQNTLKRVQIYGHRALVIADPPYVGRDMTLYNCNFSQDQFASDIDSGASQFMVTLDVSPESLERYSAHKKVYYRMNYSGTDPLTRRRKTGVEQLIYRGAISAEKIMQLGSRWMIECPELGDGVANDNAASAG